MANADRARLWISLAARPKPLAGPNRIAAQEFAGGQDSLAGRLQPLDPQRAAAGGDQQPVAFGHQHLPGRSGGVVGRCAFGVLSTVAASKINRSGGPPGLSQSV